MNEKKENYYEEMSALLTLEVVQLMNEELGISFLVNGGRLTGIIAD